MYILWNNCHHFLLDNCFADRERMIGKNWEHELLDSVFYNVLQFEVANLTVSFIRSLFEHLSTICWILLVMKFESWVSQVSKSSKEFIISVTWDTGLDFNLLHNVDSR